MRGRALGAELLGADVRSLAAVRIGLALIVLVDLLDRARDLRAHYTDAGILTRSEVLVLFDFLHAWPLCLHLAGGALWSQVLFFLLAATAATALLVGYRTPLAAAATWFLTLSLQLRNLFIGGGYDALLRLLLLWGCFVPLGARWSVDARLRPEVPERTQAVSVGTAALLMQVVIAYVSAGWAKWLEGGWGDGRALLAILGDDLRVTGAGLLLAQHPTLAAGLARAVVATEIAGPALLFLPVLTGPVRTVTVAALCAMNAAFGLCLSIGLFPWVASVGTLAFLPAWFWDWFWDRAVARAEDRPSPPPPRPAMPWRIFARQAVCAVLLAWVVVWSFGVARDPAYRAPAAVAWLGETFFLQQDWRMFARPPTRTGWLVIPGRLMDGTEVDLFAAGGPCPRLDLDSPAPVRWEKPPRVSGTFRNDRWRVLLTRGVYGAGADQRLLHYGRYLCREWNAVHAGPRQLVTFEIVLMATRLPAPPGAKRYAPDVVWRHWCFGEPSGSSEPEKIP